MEEMDVQEKKKVLPTLPFTSFFSLSLLRFKISIFHKHHVHVPMLHTISNGLDNSKRQCSTSV